MVPATFQIPAAVILLAGGLVACFAGYRMFRLVLGIYGFILGALLATSVAGAGSTGTLRHHGNRGRRDRRGDSEPRVFSRRRAARRGASGAMIVTMIWGRSGSEPHVLVVILFAVIGAVAAMRLQRYVIVTGTAFGGAWTALVGALALAGRSRGRGGRVGEQRLGGLSAGPRARPAVGDPRVAGARPGRPGRATQGRRAKDGAQEERA